MENILIYLRAEQHKTLQKRKVCVRDIGSNKKYYNYTMAVKNK